MDIYRFTKDTPVWQRIAYDYVRTDAFVAGQGIPVEMEFNGDGPVEELNGILLVEDHKPIAGCRIAYPEKGVAKIERVCVVRERQRTGVGHILIRTAEEWIREKGISHVVISSQDRAAGFYERVGYVLNPDVEPSRYEHHRPRPEPPKDGPKQSWPKLGFKCVLVEKYL